MVLHTNMPCSFNTYYDHWRAWAKMKPEKLVYVALGEHIEECIIFSDFRKLFNIYFIMIILFSKHFGIILVHEVLE